MNTILLPTDFSKNALMAADFAVTKLANESTTFILTHVYDIPRGGTSGLFYLLEELKKQAEKDLANFTSLLQERFKDKKIKLEVQLSQGDFAERTMLIAKEFKADCIVMGTKGSSGIKEVLIGSSTIDMMKQLKIPLYIVPENIQDIEIEKVILSFDGKPLNEMASKAISNFVNQHQTPLQLLHVRIGADALPIQDWSELKGSFSGSKIELHESYGESLEEGLKKGTEGAKGLLVMIKRKQSFWERFFNISDCQKAVMNTSLPMLIIPE